MSKEKTIIGIDIDGVLADYVYGLRTFVSEKLGVPRSQLPEPTDYHFSNWGEDFTKNFRNYHAEAVNKGLYLALDSTAFASQVVSILNDEEYHIRIITSRFVKPGQHATVVKDTALWLDNNGIPYRDIMFTSRKTDVYADLYIDDAPSNIEEFQKAGKNALIFNTSYNQEVTGYPRVNNWLEVKDYILNNVNPVTER